MASNTATTNYGGGIYNNGGTVNLTNGSRVQGNRVISTTGFGGGMYNLSGVLVVDASFILSNTVSNVDNSGGGGAIGNSGSSSVVSVTNGSLLQNNSASYGGGIHNSNGKVAIDASTIATNTASFFGGGIYNFGSTGILTITNGSMVVDNAAFNSNPAILTSGGGIRNTAGGQVIIDASTIASNTVGNLGGAILNTDSNSRVRITNGSRIMANRAASGGGLANQSGAITVTNSAVLTNTANNGGGIHNSNGGSVTLDASSVVSNSANNGGGLYNTGSGSGISMTNGSLLDNSAGISGGGLYQNNGSSQVTASCIVNNSATAVAYIGGTAPITATLNWWGSPSGPSGAGPGVGDSVSSNVDFSGFLGAAPAGCPTLPSPDVAITKTVLPASGLAGSAITYTIVFSNLGAGAAGGVVITDSVPASVTISSVSSSGATITQTSGAPNFAWQVSNLAVNAGGIITLTGTISTSAMAGEVITNTVGVTASNDSNTANNFAAVSTTVSAPAVCFATPDDGVTVFDSVNAVAVQQAVDAASGEWHGQGGGRVRRRATARLHKPDRLHQQDVDAARRLHHDELGNQRCNRQPHHAGRAGRRTRDLRHSGSDREQPHRAERFSG